MNIRIFRHGIVPSKRLVLGFVSLCLICALVFSFFSAYKFLRRSTDNYLGSDSVVYFLRENSFSFRSDQVPLDVLYQLQTVPGVEVVSPESFVYAFVKDQPVIIRGITENAYLLSDYFELVEGSVITKSDYQYALIGCDLAAKLNAKVDDILMVPSSTASTFLPFKVRGIFRSFSLMDSEMLIPMANIWDLDKYPRRGYTSLIRAKVNKSEFSQEKLYIYSSVGNYDISDIPVEQSEVQPAKTNISFIQRLKQFLGHNPVSDDYAQEMAEESVDIIEGSANDANAAGADTAHINDADIASQDNDLITEPADFRPAEAVQQIIPSFQKISQKMRTVLEARNKDAVYSIFYKRDFRAVIYVFAVVTFIVLLTSIFAISNIIANIIFESRKEMLILHKIGATGAVQMLIMFFRLFFVVLPASVAGSFIGFFTLYMMSKLALIGFAYFPIRPILDTGVIMSTIVFCLAISILAGLAVFRKFTSSSSMHDS
jgi:ABC-type antimicrobial peptide transport system permease subunit